MREEVSKNRRTARSVSSQYIITSTRIANNLIQTLPHAWAWDNTINYEQSAINYKHVLTFTSNCDSAYIAASMSLRHVYVKFSVL